jgi:hypothetical protein
MISVTWQQTKNVVRRTSKSLVQVCSELSEIEGIPFPAIPATAPATERGKARGALVRCSDRQAATHAVDRLGLFL